MLALFLFAVSLTSCGDDDTDIPVNNDMYSLEDQMGRPAINTVFVAGAWPSASPFTSCFCARMDKGRASVVRTERSG